MKRLLLATTVLAALTASAGQGPLVRKVKMGDTAVYSVKMELNIFGDLATYTSTLTEKVVEVLANGDYSVELSQKDYKVSLFGEEAQVAEKDMPKPIHTYSPAGNVVALKSDLQTAQYYRLAELTAVRLPGKEIKVGDAYTVEVAANAKTGVNKAKSDCKVEAEEKVGEYNTLKISFTYAEIGTEDPASSTGKMWINVADGSLVKLETAWNNAPVPGAPGQIVGTVKHDRVG